MKNEGARMDDPPRSTSKYLTVVIEPRTPGRRSLLPDVIDQLESLTRFLRSLTDDDTTLEVVSINTSSPPIRAVLRPVRPVRVRLRATGKTQRQYRPNRTGVERVSKTFNALMAEGKLPKYADPYALVQLRELAENVAKSDSKATIFAEGQEYKVDERLREQIDFQLGNVRIGYTSYTGTIKRLNIIGRKWSFTICPAAGPERILCYFGKEDLGRVKALINDVVTVAGRAVYRGQSPFPVQIKVDTITRRDPVPEGAWADMSRTLSEHWSSASPEDRELLDLEAELA